MSIIYINSYQFAAAPPSGYDPDAAAYIARVEGASGDNQALETAVKDAINAFVVGCKADGIWSAIKHSCILSGARTLAGALQPLVGTAPTNYGFIGIGTDYDRKTGLLGDGSTKYLATGVNANSSPQANNHFAIMVTSLPTANFTSLAGAGSTYRMRRGNATYNAQNHSAIPTNSITGAPSLFGTSRNASASYTYRFAGTDNTGLDITTVSTQEVLLYREQAGLASNPRLAYYSLGEFLDLALLDARVTTLINAFAAAIP